MIQQRNIKIIVISEKEKRKMEKSYSIPEEVNYMIEEIRAKYQCEIAELKEQLTAINDQLHKSEVRNIELRIAIKAMATIL
jgi:hypothetical protein